MHVENAANANEWQHVKTIKPRSYAITITGIGAFITAFAPSSR